MMRKILDRLAGYLLPAFLVLISLFLAWKNYSPGSYLIGWDSLHPEFNFGLNISRMLSGVWRQDQGLGTIAAHAHMADLPRVVVLWLFSFVLPDSLLRYFSIFSCLILGPLGMYFFLKFTFKKQNLVSWLAAFLGGLFYLLNLTTLQQFTVPFEMFSVSYACLPWIFYAAMRFMEKPDKKNLLLFAFVVLLSAPMAYASAQFFAFLACFGIFLFTYVLLNKFANLKKGFILFAVVFLVNSFWLLPNIYSAIKQATTIENSKINLLFSPEAFIRNQDYGNNTKNLATNKNFLFSWLGYDFKNEKFAGLLDVWNKHLAAKNIEIIGYSFAAIFVVGALISLIRRDKVGIGFLGVVAISTFFFININPPTGDIYSALYNNINLFREGFRMPFTKFSIPFLFATSFYFGYFFFSLFSLLKKNNFLNIFVLIIFPTVVVGLVIFMKPAFEGNLVSHVVQTNLPDDYKRVFDWFDGTTGRVVRLPLNTLWGWDYQSWNYQGSGFLGFGLNNPLLTRDYDRWSSGNESFYNQASFAVYSSDKQAFENTLKKYQVKYLLMDESIKNVGSSNSLLYIPEIKNLISNSSHVKEKAKFGFLTIYETDFDSKAIITPETYTPLNVDLNYSQNDIVYSGFGDYLKTDGNVGYPFINFDPRGDVSIVETEDKLVFENKKSHVQATLQATNKTIESFGAGRGFDSSYNCDLTKNGQVEKVRLRSGNLYRASDSGVSCDFFSYPDLIYNQGYVLRVKGKNTQGRGLKIYLQNVKTGRMDVEELLANGNFDSYFVVLPKNLSGGGYTLNVETRSFGNIASENEINLVEFIPISVDSLYAVNLGGGDPKPINNQVKVESIKKTGTWLYDIEVNGKGLFVLNQGYEDGWIAVSGGKILRHSKVNSWANGWWTESSGRIHIFYWPQILEYLGFGLVFTCFSLILTSKPKKGSI